MIISLFAVQQRFLIDSGLLRPGVSSNDVTLGTARLLAYSFAFQPLWIIVIAFPAVFWTGGVNSGTGAAAVKSFIDTLFCSATGQGHLCVADLDLFAEPVPVPIWAYSYVVASALYFAGLGELMLSP